MTDALTEAEAVLRDAIATGDTDQAPRAMYSLGVLLAAAGRREEAVAAYRDAIAGDTDEAPRAMVNLGVLLGDAGRGEEAKSVFRDAIATGHPEAARGARNALRAATEGPQ
jgi:TolA-binding protein